MKGLPVLLSLLLLVACSVPRTAPLVIGDHVIEQEETWHGEVRVRGVVTVKKGGNLTILPGTRISFEKFDRDGDGIGDGELLVEGRLTARGTAAEPILFTSAATRPAPADWKYLYLDFARGELSHVISEYAYSGLQVHFSKASVTDSEFRYNVDGVRFSTVNLVLERNLIHHNGHGLRYEERRSSGRISHNSIRDNRVGIFAVTRCSGQIQVSGNNIIGSRDYQVKFGLQQRRDVAFPGNWWGSSDPRQIAESFFDYKYDRSLGRASAPAPLDSPVVGAP